MQMGGGNGDSTSNKEACQICGDESHKGDKCPWIYNICHKPSCNGIMILHHSQSKSTYDKKYLKCQFDNCNAMIWLEDAIALKNECNEKKNTFGASSSSTSDCCYECGENGHWVRYCPWKETKYPSGCQGPRKLWTSRQDRSCGEKFLKCLKCGHFEWLKSAKCRKINVRVKLEVDLDDICKEFERNFTYKG